MKSWALAISLFLPLGAGAAEPPGFSKLRFEDDYGYLDAPGHERSVSDHVKRLPVGLADSFLSLGGEIRLRYDYQDNPEWGAEPQDRNGAFLQRYLLHGNLELGSHVRAFGELRSALEDGRRAPESPVEEGELAVQQAFLEFRGTVHEGVDARLRGGRQEMSFGSERLVAVREGPSVRRRFDAVRLDIETAWGKSTAIAAYLTENEQGVFTDGANEDIALWGVYNEFSPARAPTSFDIYYLGFRDREATYVQGTARELRHSVGVRVHGAHGPADWNWEGVIQWGTFGSADILAWTLATDTGFRLESLPFRPRIFLSANAASGDKNPNDSDLETFNPLFPRGNYFSHIALVGPRNFLNLHPGIEFELTESFVFTLDTNVFWRMETSDGLYGPRGNELRGEGTSNTRFVGTAISASIDWDINRYLFLGAIYTHVVPGGFIDRSGLSREIDFVELTARFRF